MGKRKCWLVAKTVYCKEENLIRFFQSKKLECFLPKIYTEQPTETGGKKRVLVPAVHNITFLHTAYNERQLFQLREESPVPLYFLKDITRENYAVVPEKEMNDFMELSNPNNTDIAYVEPSVIALKKGDRVRIVKGRFKDIEGKFIHFARKRAIAVTVPGVSVIFMIPGWYVEKIEG